MLLKLLFILTRHAAAAFDPQNGQRRYGFSIGSYEIREMGPTSDTGPRHYRRVFSVYPILIFNILDIRRNPAAGGQCYVLVIGTCKY